MLNKIKKLLYWLQWNILIGIIVPIMTSKTGVAEIETRGITKHYKSKTAFDGVSISLNCGGIYALVGTI